MSERSRGKDWFNGILCVAVGAGALIFVASNDAIEFKYGPVGALFMFGFILYGFYLIFRKKDPSVIEQVMNDANVKDAEKIE